MAATIPKHLVDFSVSVEYEGRDLAREWFRQARYGLFMHFGLYSLLEGEWQGSTMTDKGAEWIQLVMDIPVAEYAKLKDQFVAESFDADAICTLAVEAGMTYVNLTTQHHDGFCLWDTKTTDFNSVSAPCGRDLVKELTEACASHGLACFLYFSHGRDWWHPDAPYNVGERASRPRCPEDWGHFNWGSDHDLNRYLDFLQEQVMELCAYPNVAGIWLDGIGTFKHMEDGVTKSRAQELYDKIHAVNPWLLVSYKQGLTYTEDFYAPERSFKGHQAETSTADGALPPYEICTTLQPRSWGHHKGNDGQHQSSEWVLEQLRTVAEVPANLLLNTGLKGDGSVPQEDADVLKDVGQKLRETGFPEPALS